ncbi:LysR family transcriptional regulator [Pyxidicoccus fallax]|uniref:LysR family transcriptional regulator n=1 Tax=Pyxidicoccus fallax TaxID=394095 RepID=A0A848LFU7_9BACT|nr:LysR family transcriptional regulator [Pyxidicoccus fallax]NMO16023.1 LysR family transcriptional regulator [Pyxidicoccus fallax]NPC76964.1 LysR family transcriptional regulator [Pyxidicoccus fallax]
MRIALAVARQGSLSAAARALGTTQPTVGRRLEAFERRIGVKLFERDARGLTPTPLCAGLLEGLERMDEGALTVERRIAARDTGLQGSITVTSLDWFGDFVLAPILTRFGARHPLVTLTLINDDRRFNLSRREADLAFRPGSFDEEGLIERKVAEVSYGLYASPAYLERFGPPDFASGCAGQPIVALQERSPRSPLVRWLRGLAPEARGVLHTNSIWSQLAAAESGEVMAALPRVLGDRRPTLRRIDTLKAGLVLPIKLGVHADMRETPRVRAFIDFAVSELKLRAVELKPD